MQLAEKIYILTSTFPSDEKFGLISQIQKYAVSIPSNIAESAGRNPNKKFSNFSGIVNGSINELATQWELSVRINYIKKCDLVNVSNLISKIQKTNFTLIKTYHNF